MHLTPSAAAASLAGPTTLSDPASSNDPEGAAAPTPRGWVRRLRPTVILFAVMHVTAAIGAIRYWSWGGLALAIGVYFARMVMVTAAYHRYFSHRAFKTSRAFQLVLALGAQSAAQKGVLWWAGHHRRHHKHSD